MKVWNDASTRYATSHLDAFVSFVCNFRFDLFILQT